MWNKEISQFLITNGLKQLHTEMGLYNKNGTMVAIYVDDILFFTKDNESEPIKDLLKSKYKIKDLGVAKKVLGINIDQSHGKIKLHLNDKIKDMLEEYGMTNANSVATPTVANQSFQGNGEICDSTSYRSLVGKLLFMANTVRYTLHMSYLI